MAKILIVEDDSNLAFTLTTCLESERHVVDHLGRGFEALSIIKRLPYDLILLDWMLPDTTGVEVLKQYRSSGGTTPVLMLTGRDSSFDKATGLDAGADDYLVKPFDSGELLARVRALLRRPREIADKILKVKDVELDTGTRRVTRGGKEIELTARESAILELLMRHPNHSFSAEAILQRLWPSESESSEGTVRTQIKTLRRKLGDGSEENSLIRSMRNLGYRIVKD